MNKKAYNYSISLLTRRDYSRFKLAQKLFAKGYSENETNEVITKLIEQKYLREQAYAQARVKQFIEKGHSDERILQLSVQEHIEVTQEIIEELRRSFDLSETSTITKLLDKRLSHKSYRDHDEKMKLKLKVTRFMASKGYKYSDFSSQLDESLNSLK
jgi:regulatory protein